MGTTKFHRYYLNANLIIVFQSQHKSINNLIVFRKFQFNNFFLIINIDVSFLQQISRELILQSYAIEDLKISSEIIWGGTTRVLGWMNDS